MDTLHVDTKGRVFLAESEWKRLEKMIRNLIHQGHSGKCAIPPCQTIYAVQFSDPEEDKE